MSQSRQISVKTMFCRAFVALITIASTLCLSLQSTLAQTTFRVNQGIDSSTMRSDSDVVNAGAFKPGLMRVDFSIATQSPEQWIGELRLSRGSFDSITPIGVGATAPTDFFYGDNTKNRLCLDMRAPSTFCGVEATIFAPRDARLEATLKNLRTNQTLVKTIFVERLIDSAVKIPFDAAGNGVEIARAPADDLPIKIERFGSANESSSLFGVNETLRLLALPRTCSAKINDDLALIASARKIGEKTPFWTETQDVSLARLQQNDAIVSDPSSAPVPNVFKFTSPNTECVFEVVLELVSKKVSKSFFTLPLASKSNEPSLLARRSIQCVALDHRSPSAETIVQDAIDGDLRAELLETIDPTNPSWYKSFSRRSILPFRRVTDGVDAIQEKTGDVLKSTFTKKNGDSNDLSYAQPPKVGPVATFAEIKPSAPETQQRMDQSNGRLGKENVFNAQSRTVSSGLVLGQTVDSDFTPFGVNIFNLSSKSESEKQSLERNELLDRARYIEAWEQDGFQRFLRNLDRSSWGLTGDLWEKPISSGSSRPFNASELAKFASPQSNYIRLEPNGVADKNNNLSPTAKRKIDFILQNKRNASNSWEAYPIPIQEVGKPHLLEIEYPANFPQKLGVSILEPNAYGALFPNTLDAGLVVDDSQLSDRSTKETSRYTLLFWPRTKTPIILISNCSSKTAAAYGQIRVFRADDSKTRPSTVNRGRVFGIALTSPNICDQFSTERAPSLFGVGGVETWRSFDDAISRMTYYLSSYNYDAAMLSVAADGSALYPSKILNPCARYDRGVFLASGGDFVRKDVLSLALAKFESQRKSLMPLVKLNGTLPSIEARLRTLRGGASAGNQAAFEGVEWIGVDGKRAVDSRRQSNGGGPYYNVLHPAVEKEVLAIIDELTSRCAPFASFGGLALDVGADGWLSLPDDVYYGMDDETIARFVRESQLQSQIAGRTDRRVQELLLSKGPERYRQRAEFIRDVCLKEWLEWRVEALYQFYQKIREAVSASRPDVRLYLVATHALDGAYCQSTLYPSITGVSGIRDALRLVGLDPIRYASTGREGKSSVISQVDYVANARSNDNSYDAAITLLRPEYVAATMSTAQTAISDSLATPDAAALFSSGYSYPGSVFIHLAEKRPMYDFDALCPFRPVVVSLQTRATPANYDNRKRFARALAISDEMCFFDGGDMASFGQEEVLTDWVHAFKNLPASTFKTWSPNGDAAKRDSEIKIASSVESGDEREEKTIQPLVARYFRNDKETWFYFLNAAPFHLGVKVKFTRRSNSTYQVFAGLRREEPTLLSDGLAWSFTSTPYDLVAIKFDDPKATLDSVEITKPVKICGPDGRLHNEVREFVDRALAAKIGIETPFRNGDFEELPTKADANDLSTETPKVKETRDSSQDKSSLLGLEMPQMNLFKRSARPNEESQENSKSDVPSASQYFDPLAIPGWRAFGPSDVDVRLDASNVFEGRSSLRISSEQSVGGVICQPFDAPTTGRLCARITFGLPANAESLPLNVCLTGRINGEIFNRRVVVGDALINRIKNEKLKPTEQGTIWISDVVFFDRLPLTGLDDLSLRFELCGKGAVWLDNVKLSKLEYAKAEQMELMKLINTAEFRASNERIVDVLFMLDSYWAKMLREQIPDPSTILGDRSRRKIEETAETTETPNEENKEPSGFLDRAWGRIKFW